MLFHDAILPLVDGDRDWMRDDLGRADLDPNNRAVLLEILLWQKPDEPEAHRIYVDELARLVTYQHVAHDQDIRRSGAFSPGFRDDAQDGRGALLNALLQAPGAEAWTAKRALAQDPRMAFLRDRILHLTLESAAADADQEAWSPQEIAGLCTGRELAPKSSADMFQLMLDRLGDLEDYLNGDASPRELWANAGNERQIRRAVTDYLRGNSRGSYHVSQESVTGTEKETDIRLTSTASTQEAVIEVKLASKGWSARELRDAIHDQLLDRYMAPEHRRAGCLLVAITHPRSWQNPDGGGMLDIGGLRQMLQRAADGINQQMAGQARVGVWMLDLTVGS